MRTRKVVDKERHTRGNGGISENERGTSRGSLTQICILY